MTILLVSIYGLPSSEDILDLGKCNQEDLMLADCVEPHNAYITSTLSNITGQEILDPTFMTKFVEFTKSISTCLGSELICNKARHYKFFLDALTFIGENLYDRTVFKCLESITPKIKECLELNNVFYKNLMNTFKVTSDLTTIVNCVTGEMKINLLCKNQKTISAIGKSLNATRLMAQQYKYFEMGKMKPIVFNGNLLS